MTTLFDGLADVFRDTFGERVLYQPALGGDSYVDAVWIESSVVAGDEYSAGVQTTRPEMHIASADVPSAAEGDTLVRAGVSWRVAAPPQPDGHGMVRLVVERVV